MASRTIEQEAKLEVGLDFALPDLTGVVPGVTGSEVPRVELEATYFDTPNRRLLRRGITLRHRRDRTRAGERGEWTLKLPRRIGPSLVERSELSWPGELTEPPEEATHLVRAVIRHEDLQPLVRLITSRRRVEIRDRNGRPLAEVDDDTVAVMDGLTLTGRFREIEVELLGDDDSVLDPVVHRLAAAGAVPGRPRAKVARALDPEGDGDNPSAARPAGPDPVTRLAAAAVTGGLDRLVGHDIGLRLSDGAGDSVEHVHQARVATRRLRSDLRTFAAVFDPVSNTRVRDALRWVGAALGRVRDADVLAGRLRAQADDQIRPDDRDGLAGLQQRLADERQAAWIDLGQVLDSDRYLDLLDDLDEDLPYRPDGPAGDGRAVIGLVRRPWKSLRKAVARLGRPPSDQELHQVRIRAKRLRYAAEAVAEEVGKPGRRLARAAAGLQDVLGAHHDAVAAEAWLRQAYRSTDPVAAFVAGQLVVGQRSEQTRLRHAWPRAGRNVAAQRTRRWLRSAARH